MRLVQGEPKNYSESYRGHELAIIDTSNSEYDEVVAIPDSLLAKGGALSHPKLPFRIEVKEYYPNSDIKDRASAGAPAAGAESAASASQGLGRNFVMMPLRMTYKMDERNWPGAYVELIGPDGSLGTWLVSALISMSPRMPMQTLEYKGLTYSIALRSTRAYKPYMLTLLKFSHDRYAGTEIPKNYSSNIRITTPDGSDSREVLIYMNNPLRYAGLTFYQASFEPGNDKVTILQVVRNPGWVLPYVACSLMALGLIVQFCIHLGGFFRKRRAAALAIA